MHSSDPVLYNTGSNEARRTRQRYTAPKHDYRESAQQPRYEPIDQLAAPSSSSARTINAYEPIKLLRRDGRSKAHTEGVQKGGERDGIGKRVRVGRSSESSLL